VAVLSDKRSALLADVPALRESGGTLSQFNVGSWNGLAVPSKTPKAVVTRLNKELQTVLANPDVVKRLSDLSLHAQGSTPEQAAELLGSEIKRWGEVIVRAKIEKQ